MSLSKLTKYLLIVSITVFIFGSGYRLGEYRTSQSFSQNARFFDFPLFWETQQALEAKFVDHKKIDQKNLFYGAVKGMVAAVDDPYTFFLTPEENRESKQSLEGKFDGIGAQLGLKDHRIVVIAPLKKSPAEKAGLKAGDIILKVDGQSTEKWTLFEAVSKIRGKKGTKVALAIFRDNGEKNFSITRDEIMVESVELSYENNVALLKLNRFGDDTNREWDKAVAEIAQQWQTKKIAGVVFDMRDNPGGYLQGAVYVASEFLPENKLVVKQQYSDGHSEDYIVEKKGKLLDIPVAVLVNEGSASAAEIVAGALRDYKRAKLVGAKTFGKGSVQEVVDLSKGAGLHVTVAKWILPKGDWINGKGIMPDAAVENKISDGNTMTRQDDKQLDKAIELLLNK